MPTDKELIDLFLGPDDGTSVKVDNLKITHAESRQHNSGKPEVSQPKPDNAKPDNETPKSTEPIDSKKATPTPPVDIKNQTHTDNNTIELLFGPESDSDRDNEVDVIDSLETNIGSNESNSIESKNLKTENTELMINGLWNNNPALVQLLGLCPLLAVTSTVTNALGLGLATMLVLICTNIIVAAIRHHVPNEIRIPIFVMIIASVVTCVQLLMSAYSYGLYLSLGIFIPLIVTNCVIIGRAEAFASKNSIIKAALDGFWMGLGMLLVLTILGGLREIIGQGTLFDGADLLLGSWASVLRVEIFHIDSSFLLALLPPGAFIGVGFLIALKQLMDTRIARTKPRQAKPTIARARVTKV